MHRSIALLTGLLLASCAASADGPGESTIASATTAAAERCAQLARRQFGSDVAIAEASRVPAAAPGTVSGGPGGLIASELPGHCLVRGTINQRAGEGSERYGIRFALALPDDWSGRFLLMGGGGLNGSVAPPYGPVAAGATPALARGFAVVSHDSGHEGAVFDDAFAADQRAALDFADSSVPTVTEAAKAITAAFYGAPIAHSYMTGCSTGGREGMLAIQRHPELFDGVVVGAPAMRTGHSNLALAKAAVDFNQAAPRDADGLPVASQIFSPADRQTIRTGLLAQCDGLDGLDDGVIENVAQCRFRPAELQCGRGESEGCLSGKQVTALERAFQPPRDAAGHAAYVPFPYDTGIVFTGPGLPGFLPTGQPGVFGPPSRDLAIDVDARLQAIRADAMQRLTDTHVWTDLNTFLERGGKVLFYHGVSDPWFSAFDTWDWWQRAAETNGAAFSEASRLYMVPGMMHCAGGDAFDRFDLLSAVADWVEQAEAPAGVVASRADGSAARPLCPYPSHAHYLGGDPAKAESFACRGPGDS